MTKSITILYDAPPLGDDLLTLNDYGGMVIYSAMAAPLMRYAADGSTITGPYCESYHCDMDGRLHRFCIRTGFTRVNGEPIGAEDYASVINLARVQQSQAAILLRHVRPGPDGVRVSGNELIIETCRSDFLIPSILASCRLSPDVSIHDPARSAGPYYLVDKGVDRYQFKRNPGFPIRPADKAELLFQHCRSSENNYAMYVAEQADITCNTAFPYQAVQSSISHSDFVAQPNALTMALVFIPSEDSFPKRQLRRSLNHLIDRSVLVQRLHRAVTVANDLQINRTPPCQIEIDRLFNPDLGTSILIQELGPNSRAVQLNCGYDDYYPNRQVVEHIRDQLRPYGIEINPIKDVFESPAYESYQMKLMILFPEIYDDIGLYATIPYSTPMLVEKEDEPAFLDSLNSYCGCSSPEERRNYLLNLDAILSKGAYLIPLLKMNDLYFQSPKSQAMRYSPFPDYVIC